MVTKTINDVHNVRLVKYILYTRLKVKKLKYSNQTFSAVCHHQGDDGKQPKRFGLNILIF